MVVLHEALPLGDAHLRLPLRAVGLSEEAPLIAVNVGLDDHEARQAARKDAHGGAAYRRREPLPRSRAGA